MRKKKSEARVKRRRWRKLRQDEVTILLWKNDMVAVLFNGLSIFRALDIIPYRYYCS